ncbi:serine/threonine-protein kinase [Azospirillum sp. ST 5-10]|uniref:serine/threonine-protein kinase n=1 Tax=unclassified Azospirillum TaxID=2630922 RepID=UPI003F4A239D
MTSPVDLHAPSAALAAFLAGGTPAEALCDGLGRWLAADAARAAPYRGWLARQRAAGRLPPALYARLAALAGDAGPDPVARGAPPRLRPGLLLAERWVIEGLLAEGGIAAVYAALDLTRPRRAEDAVVALKVVHRGGREEAAHLLEHEAGVVRRLRQRGLAGKAVTAIAGVSYHDGLPFLVMERLKGETLQARLRRLADGVQPRDPVTGGLPLAEAAAIVGRVAATLAFAHRERIVHGDVKPANVFLGRDGAVTLLDFGAARDHGEDGPLSGVTQAYASPRVLAGAAPEAADDVFALAVLACEVLAGRHPFGRRDAATAQAEGLRPPSLPGLTRRQRAVLARALALGDDARRPDAAALAQAFARRRPGRAAAAALLAAGLLGLAAWGWTGWAGVTPDAAAVAAWSRSLPEPLGGPLRGFLHGSLEEATAAAVEEAVGGDGGPDLARVGALAQRFADLYPQSPLPERWRRQAAERAFRQLVRDATGPAADAVAVGHALERLDGFVGGGADSAQRLANAVALELGAGTDPDRKARLRAVAAELFPDDPRFSLPPVQEPAQPPRPGAP